MFLDKYLYMNIHGYAVSSDPPSGNNLHFFSVDKCINRCGTHTRNIIHNRVIILVYVMLIEINSETLHSVKKPVEKVLTKYEPTFRKQQE